MPTTSNFGWTTPADTDLVKDGAAAIRTLGNGIDTSLVDLKGGTTGQNLRKASNTDLDFTFAGDATNTVIDAAGDLLYGTANDTLGRLAIGTAGQVLKVNSGATAPEWGAAAAGAMTKISSTTFSAVTQQDFTGFSSTYDNYLIVLNQISATTGNDDLLFRFLYNSNADVQATSYFGGNFQTASGGTTTATGINNGTSITISTTTGTTADPTSGFIYVNLVAGGSIPAISGQVSSISVGYSTYFGSSVNVSRSNWSGFRLLTSGGNFAGTVKVYGLEK